MINICLQKAIYEAYTEALPTSTLVKITLFTIFPGIWILVNHEMRKYVVRKVKLLVDIQSLEQDREKRRRVHIVKNTRRRRRRRRKNRVDVEEVNLNIKCRQMKLEMKMEEMNVRELMSKRKAELSIQDIERGEN